MVTQMATSTHICVAIGETAYVYLGVAQIEKARMDLLVSGKHNREILVISSRLPLNTPRTWEIPQHVVPSFS
jgi:hypothetical protein